MNNSSQVLSYCQQTAVIPVLQLDDVASAVDIAHALFDGGLSVLEITLRTKNAMAIISAVANALPQATIAAGSVLTTEQMREVKDAGAKFAVSPGTNKELLTADILPLLSGVQTASEVMHLLSCGFDFAKFFPATAAGGVNMLRAFSGPLPQMKFCPTGGINLNNASDFLALPNVVCVGGSWLVAADDNHKTIYGKAQQAAKLKS